MPQDQKRRQKALERKEVTGTCCPRIRKPLFPISGRGAQYENSRAGFPTCRLAVGYGKPTYRRAAIMSCPCGSGKKYKHCHGRKKK
jgi:uncharacterized protein YecA (UPF0149 family)